MNWVLTYYMFSQMMADLTESGASPIGTGILEACFLGLAQVGSPPPTVSLTMGQVVEANYDGYARQEVVWFPTFVSGSGPQTIIGHTLFFAPTDDTVPNTITQVFLATALTGGQLLAASVVTPSVIITTLDAAMVVKPLFSLPLGGPYGQPDVET